MRSYSDMSVIPTLDISRGTVVGAIKYGNKRKATIGSFNYLKDRADHVLLRLDVVNADGKKIDVKSYYIDEFFNRKSDFIRREGSISSNNYFAVEDRTKLIKVSFGSFRIPIIGNKLPLDLFTEYEAFENEIRNITSVQTEELEVFLTLSRKALSMNK